MYETTQKAGKNIAGLQALRGIAVLLVLAIHVWAIANNAETASTSARGGQAEFLLSPWLYHGVSGVDLFFVISGFIMVQVTKGKRGAKHVGDFLFARAARIYPMAWFFTAVALLAFAVKGNMAEYLSGRGGILFSFLLLPDKDPPLLGVSWTLIHEVYFYCVFAVFLFAAEKRLIFCLTIWGGLIAVAEALGLAQLNPWTKIAFHPLTYEFIAGAAIGLMARRPAPNTQWLFGGVALAAIMLVLGAIWIGRPDPNTYPTEWGRVIAFTPGWALMVYCVVGLEKRGRVAAPRFLVRIGDWSYSLYLSHFLVMSAVALVWQRFSAPGYTDNVLLIIAMVGAAIASAWAVNRGMERPINNWVKQFRTASIRPVQRPSDIGTSA